jgi:hypothetical protein
LHDSTHHDPPKNLRVNRHCYLKLSDIAICEPTDQKRIIPQSHNNATKSQFCIRELVINLR